MANAPRPEKARFATARWDASEQVALEIRRYLERAGLAPGDRIGTEQELAAEFQVSRPTLREALRLLASSHLIRVGRGRSGGIFVGSTPGEGMGRNVSESIAMMLATESTSMQELLDARMFLEVPLAGLAARNADARIADDLDAQIAAAEPNEPGTEPFNAADTRFHQILAEAAGNELLQAFTGWILEVLQPHLIERIAVHVAGGDILDQHRDIARAVRRGQQAAAERAMHAHIDYLLDILHRSESRPAAVKKRR
jgi:DNA-binding FadR family transcriptional regulator